jgi:YD repeat-containing protein
MSFTNDPSSHSVSDLRGKVAKVRRRDGVHVIDTDEDGDVLSVVVEDGAVVRYTYTSAAGQPIEATLERSADPHVAMLAADPLPVVDECFICKRRDGNMVCRQVPCPPSS